MKKYFFCGVGGSGMSALALALKNKGYDIGGSDRAYDADVNTPKFDVLKNQGVRLFAQDGSGVDEHTDVLVVSSAVEETIPDVVKARRLNVPVMKRAEVLADFLHEHNGIAVGGTSGKTTTTAMIGHILREAGLDPSVINGGVMLNYADSLGMGNVLAGKGSFCVIEADESDGSIELYKPAVSVLTTISLDHKPLEELRVLFGDFVERATVGAVLNADNADVLALKDKNPNVLTFSASGNDADLKAENVTPAENGVRFVLDGEEAFLPVIGRHNVANALAAVGAAMQIGIPASQALKALSTFKGVHRRLETVGVTKKNIAVIDDFAHNPEKVAASLSALKDYDGRLIVIYQPHGFKPTKIMRKGLVDAFDKGLGLDDTLIMQEIYYAGGTAQKDISSADLVRDLERTGKRVHFISDRKAIVSLVKGLAAKGDRIVVMGARDDTLSDFARNIFEALS